VYPKDHVTGMVPDGGIRMCSTIIEQLHDGFHGGLDTLGLLGGNSAKCSKECATTALA